MRIPPPVIFVGSILLGAVLGVLGPVSSDWLSGGVARVVGIPILLIALILVVLTFREFRKAGTGVDYDRTRFEDTVKALITGGPFRYSRNPAYLSAVLLQLGLGIWLRNVWMVLLLLATILLITIFSIVPEERFLEQRFGESYREYRSRVRRWL